jgi:hypothetical protein
MVATGVYSSGGLKISVADMIKDPLIIRERMLDISRNQFMMEDLLRRVPAAQSGVIAYSESAPLFAAEDPEIVAEGAEIPLITGEDGVPKAAFTVKRAAGIEVTIETRNRNRVDKVNQRMVQVRNTFVRAMERAMFTALSTATTLTATASAAWSVTTTDIRGDVLTSLRKVREASLSGATPGPDVNDYLGFEPDTLVMSTRTEALFFNNDSVAEVYERGSVLDPKAPRYTGTLEKEFMGLRVLTSRFMDDGFVWILERKTVGGFSDERPLSVTPLYEDKPRETWRADVVRHTGIFVDQPKAAIKLDITP